MSDLDPAEMFRKRAVATLRGELPKERQEAFDAWRDAGAVSLQEQLALLTEDAMKRYQEPEFLKARVEVKDILGLLTGKKATP